MPVDPAKTDIAEFHKLLKSSKRVLALCGAGMSVASGLTTFTGRGTMYRGQYSAQISTTHTFMQNPGLVWQFLASRRHEALQAQPNACHLALTEFARKKRRDFMCLSQNIDGLSEKAGHPKDNIIFFHGTLLDLHCDNYKTCDYVDMNNREDPVCPALQPAIADIPEDVDPGSLPPLPRLSPHDLPHCPKCGSLLRPRTILFGEDLKDEPIDQADAWVAARSEDGSTSDIDLILVIGTRANVFPAANYVNKAKAAGAVVAVVNVDSEGLGQAGCLRLQDFFFQGDASELVPRLLAPIIGKDL